MTGNADIAKRSPITFASLDTSTTTSEVSLLKLQMVRQIEAMGVPKKRLVAKIAGGARMFEVSGSTSVGNIGEKNAIASKQKLQELGIPILAEDTGLNYGRTVELNCANGDYVIKAVGKPVKTI